MDRSAVTGALQRFFETTDIVCAYLFGSTARGTTRPDSDVDVAILLRGHPPRTLDALPLDLEEELQRVLGCEVDLVDLRSAAPDLVHRVLRDGVLVHDADRSARIAFEVAARNEYFDIRPTLDQYRRLQ